MMAARNKIRKCSMLERCLTRSNGSRAIQAPPDLGCHRLDSFQTFCRLRLSPNVGDTLPVLTCPVAFPRWKDNDKAECDYDGGDCDSSDSSGERGLVGLGVEPCVACFSRLTVGLTSRVHTTLSIAQTPTIGTCNVWALKTILPSFESYVLPWAGSTTPTVPVQRSDRPGQNHMAYMRAPVDRTYG